ncbi:restriction endonuclease subunit S [bacterium]|nr:restriction endonuclease subunit S [bacterium]
MQLTEKQKTEGWRIVKFGDVAKECKEKVDRDNNPFEKYVAGGDMDSENLRISRWGVFGDDYVGPAFHRVFRKGQILYGSRRTYLKKVAVADFDGITANTTFVIEPRKDSFLVPGLLPHIMLSDCFTKHSVANSKGSTNPYIVWSDIAKYEFPLPPRPRQEEMLEVFEKIEDNLFQYEQSLSQADRTLSVLRYEKMMKHDEGDELQSISSVAEINPKCQPNKGSPITFCDMAALDTDSKSISGELIKKEKPSGTRFMNGDVLFARITPCTENGKLALVDFLKDGETGYGSTEFIVLRGNKVEPLYLYHLCRTRKLRHYAIDRMIGTSGRKRVPKEVFDEIKVPLPSKDEQQKILNVLESIEGQKENIKTSVKSLIGVRNKYLKNILEEAA